MKSFVQTFFTAWSYWAPSAVACRLVFSCQRVRLSFLRRDLLLQRLLLRGAIQALLLSVSRCLFEITRSLHFLTAWSNWAPSAVACRLVFSCQHVRLSFLRRDLLLQRLQLRGAIQALLLSVSRCLFEITRSYTFLRRGATGLQVPSLAALFSCQHARLSFFWRDLLLQRLQLRGAIQALLLSVSRCLFEITRSYTFLRRGATGLQVPSLAALFFPVSTSDFLSCGGTSCCSACSCEVPFRRCC